MSAPYAKVKPWKHAKHAKTGERIQHHGHCIGHYVERKQKMSELNKAWRDVYYMLEDNAFDYVGKPFYNDKEGTVQLWNGSQFITYAEVPF